MNDSKRLYVRPADGKIVRHPYPSHQPLRREGQYVANTSFWRRRIKDKDVFLITETKPNPNSTGNRRRKIEPDKSKIK